MLNKNNQFNNWRDFQKSLKPVSRKKRDSTNIKRLFLVTGGSLIGLIVLLFGGSWLFAHLGQDNHISLSVKEELKPASEKIKREDLKGFLYPLDMGSASAEGRFSAARDDKKITIETGLDMRLQGYISRLLSRSMTHQAAVVVLRPHTGQILAMASHFSDEPANNESGKDDPLYLKSEFPAASLFKIIAAATVIEARGFSPDKPLYYNGRKYTLYKSQLNQKKGRYTAKTSLRKAFAGSINPVFGKLGIYDLGKELMADYSGRFMFNREIPFDLPMPMSHIEVPDDDFGLAEIASGFNKRTLVSPIHAGLITCAIANKGVMMAPWFVTSVRDESGKALYNVNTTVLGKPITEETAGKMRRLMADTVISGTCRKTFRSLRNKLKNMEIGAKTGTINDKFDKYKYDWLTAYVLPKNSGAGISVTTLAIHGEMLGIRAKDISKAILNYYYPYLTKGR